MQVYQTKALVGSAAVGVDAQVSEFLLESTGHRGGIGAGGGFSEARPADAPPAYTDIKTTDLVLAGLQDHVAFEKLPPPVCFICHPELQDTIENNYTCSVYDKGPQVGGRKVSTNGRGMTAVSTIVIKQ